MQGHVLKKKKKLCHTFSRSYSSGWMGIEKMGHIYKKKKKHFIASLNLTYLRINPELCYHGAGQSAATQIYELLTF